jgi:hypothetical protein
MSHWPFLLKHLSYSPVNPFDSFHTRRESTDPTVSNSLAYFSGLKRPKESMDYFTGPLQHYSPYERRANTTSPSPDVTEKP